MKSVLSTIVHYNYTLKSNFFFHFKVRNRNMYDNTDSAKDWGPGSTHKNGTVCDTQHYMNIDSMLLLMDKSIYLLFSHS